MSRIKEPPIGTTEIPNYKSPPSRILRSLRQGYDNTREKIAKKSEQIQGLHGKLRDVQESREEWKLRAKAAEARAEAAERDAKEAENRARLAEEKMIETEKQLKKRA